MPQKTKSSSPRKKLAALVEDESFSNRSHTMNASSSSDDDEELGAATLEAAVEVQHKDGGRPRVVPSPSPPSLTGTAPARTPRTMSVASKLYDRDGKGYLDETERALRRMDTQNRGFLTVDKLYVLMEGLQDEQKKSAELISALQEQQHRAINLKRAVIGLCGFALLLALANIGTSFAAARLAKETSVSESGELVVKGTGVTIATANHVVEITVDIVPYDNSTEGGDRRLLDGVDHDAIHRRMADICGQSGGNTVCRVQGEI